MVGISPAIYLHRLQARPLRKRFRYCRSSLTSFAPPLLQGLAFRLRGRGYPAPSSWSAAYPRRWVSATYNVLPTCLVSGKSLRFASRHYSLARRAYYRASRTGFINSPRRTGITVLPDRFISVLATPASNTMPFRKCFRYGFWVLTTSAAAFAPGIISDRGPCTLR